MMHCWFFLRHPDGGGLLSWLLLSYLLIITWKFNESGHILRQQDVRQVVLTPFGLREEAFFVPFVVNIVLELLG